MTLPINLQEYENQAMACLSPMARDYYASGACDETTLHRNRAGFSDYAFRPKVLVDVSERDMRAQVLGQTLSMPVVIAPTAFHRLAHDQGECATARAASAMGIAMTLSTLSTTSLEDVGDVCTNGWFQLYVHRDRALTLDLVRRAEAAGFSALCLTVDAPLLGRRERDHKNTFSLPEPLTLANFAGVDLPHQDGHSGLFDYFTDQLDTSLNWADLDWLQAHTSLPVIVKGIMRADDALRAQQHGVAGLVVSNHGGRQLDGTDATVHALADIATALEGRMTILLDGGIRRGTDVLTALALGADAVMLGRPVLWALAVNGQAGVEHMLALLKNELDLAMALSGCPSIDAIGPELLSSAHG